MTPPVTVFCPTTTRSFLVPRLSLPVRIPRELVDLPEGGRAARLTVVTAALSHPMDIYGQMIEYLRMNGIDPQKI